MTKIIIFFYVTQILWEVKSDKKWKRDYLVLGGGGWNCMRSKN